jgi:hypothetical protein
LISQTPWEALEDVAGMTADLLHKTVIDVETK